MSEQAAQDRQCESCGRSLGALPANAACPGCGATRATPEEHPQQEARRKSWVRRGLSIYLAGTLTVLLFYFYHQLNIWRIGPQEFFLGWSLDIVHYLYMAELIVPAGFFAAGAWMIASPRQDAGASWYPRRLLRTAASVTFVLVCLRWGPTLLPESVTGRTELYVANQVCQIAMQWMLWTCIRMELAALGHGLMASHVNVLRWAATMTLLAEAVTSWLRMTMGNSYAPPPHVDTYAWLHGLTLSAWRLVVVWELIMLVRTRMRLAAAVPGGFFEDIFTAALKPLGEAIGWIAARLRSMIDLPERPPDMKDEPEKKSGDDTTKGT